LYETMRIRDAGELVKCDIIHHIPSITRQRDPADRFRIGRTRLRKLPSQTSDLYHGTTPREGEDDCHL